MRVAFMVVVVGATWACVGTCACTSRAAAVDVAPSSTALATAPPSLAPAVDANAPRATSFALTAKDIVLVGAGDIASCSSDDDERTAHLIEGVLARASPASRVFTAGDNVYPSGTIAEFRDCYLPTWGRFLSRTIPAPGNHDWVTPGAAGYFATFGASAGTANAPWHSVDVGGWHVVVLDSDCDKVGGCDASSAQYAWLTADLAQAPNPCSVAIWHHPLFSSGAHGSDARMAALWDLLDRNGLDVVLAGHDHLYERFAPLHADGSAGGIASFIVGTGGATAYPFTVTRAGSLMRHTGDPAVFTLILRENTYTWGLLAVDGRTLDTGEGNCR